uniref:Ribonuclease like 2 n=1 Tax=Sinocyclocheilus rhinocerous TaxID=307959 RepID=A0A673MFN6_9TELE
MFPRYENFLNQHLGPHVNEHICDTEIRKRHITAPGTANGCKEVNTFIQVNLNDLKAVCDPEKGKPQGNNMFMSNTVYHVVTCKLRSGARHPRCTYRGRKSTRYVVLGCDGGWPVHYDEGIING